MTLYCDSNGVQIFLGDALQVLKMLPGQSVNCVVTSPPYWGLRDYGTAAWEGGDEKCDHLPGRETSRATGKNSTNTGSSHQWKDFCRKCDAVRVDSQLGLESTPEEYVLKLVEIFREVRRVLRDDGTVWLNLGDSYSGSGKGPSNSLTQAVWDTQPARNNAQARAGAPTAWLPIPSGLKPKDLVGIPWRVAFALQSDGWYLRSDIIWHKPNPMPESVTDRPTKAHEYLFLLSKSERYFYNAKAIKEPATGWNGSRFDDPRDLEVRPTTGRKERTNGKWSKEEPNSSGKRIVENVARARSEGANHDSPFGEFRNKRSVWTVSTQPFNDWAESVQWVRVARDVAFGDRVRIALPDCPKHGVRFVQVSNSFCDEHGADWLIHKFGNYVDLFREPVYDFSPTRTRLACLNELCNSGCLSLKCVLSATDRNSETHKKAHEFLTSPACIVCDRKPLHTADKIMELLKTDWVVHKFLNNTSPDDLACHPLVEIPSSNEDISSCFCIYYIKKNQGTSHFATFPEKLIEPCILAGCPEGGTVLDPFIGSGTTAAVAQRLNCKAIGIELNSSYIELAMKRLAQSVLAF